MRGSCVRGSRVGCANTSVPRGVTRLSELLLPTERQPPADAEALSHKLMVRAGLDPPGRCRPVVVASGRLARAPEGRRDHPRGDRRDRRPGDADAARTPAELWREVRPRRDPRAVQAADRRGAELLLAMSHEETTTFHVATAVRSYRDLPKLLYHFQTQGARRAAPARRRAAHARVRDEGRLFVRPRRGRPRRQLRAAAPAPTSGSSTAAGSSGTRSSRTSG